MTGVPVVGNIAIGVVQGSRAKRQLDRVALLSQAPATVVRDGTEQSIKPSDVVLGDIVRRQPRRRDPARRPDRRRRDRLHR